MQVLRPGFQTGSFLKAPALALAAVCFITAASLGTGLAKEPSAQASAGAGGHLQLILDLPDNAFMAELGDAKFDAGFLAQVALLPEQDMADRIRLLAQSGDRPGPLVALLIAAITENPGSDIRELVIAAAPPDLLPPLATALLEDIETRCATLEEAVLEGLVLAALSFNRRRAEDMVRFGNMADADCAAMFGTALARITETADDLIASALETALALEGGVMMQMVSVLRGEVDVAPINDGPGIPPAPPPAGPLAGVGGGTTTPGGTDGTLPGHEAIFAQNPGRGAGPGTIGGGTGGNGISLLPLGGSNNDIVSPNN